MSLVPLAQLLEPKARPVTTLDLWQAFREKPAATVASYVFTETIRGYMTQILESVSTGRPQGFWVQAEYGAGKTHFLATLAALLAQPNGQLWDLLQDDEVHLFVPRLREVCLFPVIVSLRGMGAASVMSDRSLLDVILEEGFLRALEKAGLAGQVRLTTADDYTAWFERQATPEMRQLIESFLRQRTGQSFAAYLDAEGSEATADFIADYCRKNAIRIEVASSVRDRLAHVYHQITTLPGNRYRGLLVILDEYEGWERTHPDASARAQDEDVLETLAYLLPRDLGYNIWTVVASQSAVPAKLHGGQAGDRFIPLPLLASRNERDYDVIVSRRVRGLRPERSPEISDYYLYYRQHFEYAARLTEEQFRDVFPFQPRCFEVIRHITARDLPTTRSGITIMHELVNDAELLDRSVLIRVADCLRSPHLEESCLNTDVYKKAHNAYKMAQEALPALELDDEDRPLAEAVLATLFLWYLAYMEAPQPLGLNDLTQATLTTADYLTADDRIAYVLGKLRSLPQIQYEGDKASFVPEGVVGDNPLVIFSEYRRRALEEKYQLSALWSESLFYTTQETRGPAGLFAGYGRDESKRQRFEQRRLEYDGEVIIASQWRLDHGLPLPKDRDCHFRLVILTGEPAQPPQPSDLQDARIAVVLPGALSEEVRRAAADYLAWQRMSEDYGESHRSGPEAEAVRTWLQGQQPTVLANLMQAHLRPYQNATIVTKNSIAINASEVFGLPSNDQRFGALVERLLAAAYPQLPLAWQELRSSLRANEITRLFDGFFAQSPTGAAKAAVRNFGPVLRLCDAASPEHFAPTNCPVFVLIREQFEENHKSLPIWKLYERLAGPPYGLPYTLIQLYLYAFVRAGNPRVEVELKQGHGLRRRTGQPFPHKRLTQANVLELEFKPDQENAFTTMIEGLGHNWNDILPYAREIGAELRATSDPTEVEAEAGKLGEALARLGQQLKALTPLETLTQALAAQLPAEESAARRNLFVIAATAGQPYEAFYDQAATVYTSPEALRSDLAAHERLRQLANSAADIIAAKHYLDGIKLRPSDRELNFELAALKERFSLASLVAQPSLWGPLQADYNNFRLRYRNQYRKHHRDTQDEIKRLAAALEKAPRHLDSLALLNGIKELGAPCGQGLAEQYRQLHQRLQLCPVPLEDLKLENVPTCSHCSLSLQEVAPTEEVQLFARSLENALEEQRRRLASQAIHRILMGSGEDAITKFVQVVQTANLTALVEALDDTIVEFIQVLLAEENVAAGESDALRRFAREYPTLDEADLPAALARFQQLLEEDFVRARQANPDKERARLTLR